jgi:hypothetical protein
VAARSRVPVVCPNLEILIKEIGAWKRRLSEARRYKGKCETMGESFHFAFVVYCSGRRDPVATDAQSLNLRSEPP